MSWQIARRVTGYETAISYSEKLSGGRPAENSASAEEDRKNLLLGVAFIAALIAVFVLIRKLLG